MMEQIEGHYDRYRLTRDTGEKFAYIFEMLTLRERLCLVYMDSKDINRTNLMSKTIHLLDPDDIADYSKEQLKCLAYVIGKLERPEMSRVIFYDVIKNLERIVNPTQKD